MNAMDTIGVRGIDHVEFWVGDARRAAAALVGGLGFRIRAESAGTGPGAVLVGQGSIRLRLVGPAEPGDEVDEFVRRHGGAVALIALRVPDAAAAHARAVELGATPVAPSTTDLPSVAGFGDVVLSFLDRPEPGSGPKPELGLEPEPGSEPGTGQPDLRPGEPDLLRELDHVAICVPSGQLERTAQFCDRVLGFRRVFAEYIDIGAQGMDSIVVQSPSGTVTFTFLEPDTTREPGQIDGFLAAHGGAGVQHLAFRTDDIASAVRTFQQQGLGFLTTPSSYYDAIETRLGPPDIPLDQLRELNVLVDRDHGGQLFQIFTRSVHPRATYFSELIERRGASTFGTANITALYEAVARGQTEPDS
jgi:4-hydroxymandelate synthase